MEDVQNVAVIPTRTMQAQEVYAAALSFQSPRILGAAELRVDRAAHRVYVAAQEVPLTPLEYKLLLRLAEQPEHVHTRERLLDEVWQVNAGNTTRTVDTHVKRLRDKLGNAGRLIQTVRGVGYRLSETPSPQGADGRCDRRHGSDADPLPRQSRPVSLRVHMAAARSVG
jgi:two-component system phosphate regulon response regulator PhoB